VVVIMSSTSTEVPMITEQDIRDNAGPAQFSLENTHLKGWIDKFSSYFRQEMDQCVDRHPTALASEKVDMKRLNKKMAHVIKHKVFSSELMRRSMANARMTQLIDLYDLAGFANLSHCSFGHVEDMRGIKALYGRIFVAKARSLFGEKDCFIAERAANAQHEDLSYEDKIKHRRMHGRSIESPVPSSSEDEKDSDKDLGSLKSARRAW
jgi:hypothetical protein